MFIHGSLLECTLGRFRVGIVGILLLTMDLAKEIAVWFFFPDRVLPYLGHNAVLPALVQPVIFFAIKKLTVYGIPSTTDGD